MLGHFLHAVQRLVNLLVALETEGDGDNADGEDVHLAGALCHDGSCAGAGAASHSCGDEGHACAVGEELLDLLDGLEGSLASLLGFVAGAETLAHLEFIGHGGVG